MNDLEKIFTFESERLIDKWDSYFDAYDKFFSRYRNKPMKMLEIGVFKGGSMQMWKKYFGKEVEIVGFDIDPTCKRFEDEQVKIIIGDQGNEESLKALVAEHPKFDIIIDDGSHFNVHQINTFKFLFDYLTDGGVYLVEDLHTSYWSEYGGALYHKGTFIEFAKGLVDEINGYCQRPPAVTKYTNEINSINFFFSLAFFEKKRLKYTPHDVKSENGKIVEIGCRLPKIKLTP